VAGIPHKPLISTVLQSKRREASTTTVSEPRSGNEHYERASNLFEVFELLRQWLLR